MLRERPLDEIKQLCESYLDGFVGMDWIGQTLVEESKVEINTSTCIIELGHPERIKEERLYNEREMGGCGMG